LGADYKIGSDIPPMYTSETCEEFQRLLCHLLRSYEAALLTLDDFKGRSLKPDEVNSFEIAVYCVATCGLTLRDLVYSSFLQEHLARIRLAVPQAQPRTWTDSLSVRDAYVDWLKSQVIYFEAANNLIGISSHFCGARVSLRFADVQPPCSAMRPLPQVMEEIVSYPQLGDFPTYTVQDAMSMIESVVSGNASLKSHLKDILSENFRGTLHCEAFLACFVHRSNSTEVGLDEISVSATPDVLYPSDVW